MLKLYIIPTYYTIKLSKINNNKKKNIWKQIIKYSK